MEPSEDNTTTPPSDIQAQVDYYEDISHGLRLYVTPIILFGGTAGNLITIVVVLSRHFRNTPASVLLLTLAIVDIGVLYFNLLDIWLGSLLGSKSLHLTRDQGWFGCKLSSFMTYFLSHSSSWILVLINIERVLSLYKPQTANVWCTKPRLGIALCGLLVLLTLVNVHLFWTAEFNADAKDYKCQLLTHEFWSSMDAALFCYIPFVVILGCNIALLVRLLGQDDISLLDKNSSSSSSTQSGMHSVTAMLLAISIVFLLTTSPLVICYQMHTQLMEKYANDPVGMALHMELVINTVLVLLCYSNNALNFFLYCLSGARFRQALRDICCTIRGGCCRGHPQPLSEVSTSHNSMETRID